jgi:hypothetical protein
MHASSDELSSRDWYQVQGFVFAFSDVSTTVLCHSLGSLFCIPLGHLHGIDREVSSHEVAFPIAKA